MRRRRGQIAPQPENAWISGAEAARRCGVSWHVAARTMTLGGVRQRRLPGRAVEWNAADLAALLERSVTSTASA